VHLIDLADNAKPRPIEIHLAKSASISGVVVDERGEPVPGVPVTAFRRATGGAATLSRAASDAVTDDRGVYRIAQLQPDGYIVGVVSTSTTLPEALATQFDVTAKNPMASFDVVRQLIPGGMIRFDDTAPTGEGFRSGPWVLQRSGPALPPAPDGRPLVYAATLYPGTTLPSDATTITLRSGEERTNVDLPLRVSPAVRVSGVLSSPAGPMANIAIRLLPPQLIDLGDLNPGVATAVTDANGAFALLAVPPGQYSLNATFIPEQAVRAGGDAPTSLWVSQPVTVGDTDITGLAVTMRPGLRVSGRVEYKGAPPPPDSPPLTVVLQPLGAGLWRSSLGRGGANGTFSTGGDPPGPYSIFLIGQQMPATLVSVTRGGRPIANEVIELEAGDVDDLVLTISSAVSHVTGSVVDAKGVADGATNVFVFSADPTGWRDSVLNRRVCLTAASASGSFDCKGLAPGDYFIVAVDARVAPARRDPAMLESLVEGATRFTLIEGEDKRMNLKTFTPRGR
jgi:hypothetical protein